MSNCTDDDMAAGVMFKKLTEQQQSKFDNMALKGAHEYIAGLEGETSVQPNTQLRYRRQTTTCRSGIMKIGNPVKNIPVSNVTYGKYRDIWRIVLDMQNGAWLPVTCDSIQEASNLYCAAQTHRTLSVRAKRRGTVGYVQKKSDTGGQRSNKPKHHDSPASESRGLE